MYFRSVSQHWETPQDFFDRLHTEFGFTVDVCALPDTAKCPRYFTPETDGLAQDWTGEVCWCNPPYGPQIGRWMRKAYESALTGALVVCLVPARTDTRWWHTYVEPYAEKRFVQGRLKFSNAKHSATFPSALAIFRPLAKA